MSMAGARPMPAATSLARLPSSVAAPAGARMGDARHAARRPVPFPRRTIGHSAARRCPFRAFQSDAVRVEFFPWDKSEHAGQTSRGRSDGAFAE
jgi:hypothetical protein